MRCSDAVEKADQRSFHSSDMDACQLGSRRRRNVPRGSVVFVLARSHADRHVSGLAVSAGRPS
eukprot:1257655-Pleurochrysis_carterae.AAC.1